MFRSKGKGKSSPVHLKDLLNDLERSDEIKKRIKGQLSKPYDPPVDQEWSGGQEVFTTATVINVSSRWEDERSYNWGNIITSSGPGW